MKKSTVNSKQSHGKATRENARHFKNIINNEEEFRCFEESPEILNSCVFRQSSMLGKGTFIIRRGSTKRPPRAMDIFSNYETSKDGLSESEPDVDSESERAKYISNDVKQIDPPPCDIKDTNSRHSLDISKPLTSPRERLSLNLDPHYHQSSLKKDHSPILHLSKSNIECK